MFSLSSVLIALLTPFLLDAVGRTGSPSLLSAHPSPLKFHLRKVVIIKSCLSVTCKKLDFFYPLTQLIGFVNV